MVPNPTSGGAWARAPGAKGSTPKEKGPRRALVTGAAGFIGCHLVDRLRETGYWVRGVDIRKPEYGPIRADEFVLADLRKPEACTDAVRGMADVYQLAADMGGIGYISTNHASLTRNNILINANMLEAARLEPVERYLYASSACVYPTFLQSEAQVVPLVEADAKPADPEKGYGWEKLFAEELTTYYHEDYGLDVRIVRFHNIYGPQGTYEGGREKAPAALCRKVAEAGDGGVIEIWGDGAQRRSFCYIGDCIEGIERIMASGHTGPINLGSEDLVTVDDLVDIVCHVAGKSLQKHHDPSKPQGVRGRNSDNRLLRKIVAWEPTTSLEDGLTRTYAWIWSQLDRVGRARPPAPRRFRLPLPSPQELGKIAGKLALKRGRKDPAP